MIPVEEIEVHHDLTFDKEPVQIFYHDVKMLRGKLVSFVNVLWRNHNSNESTWEPEDAMRKQYPDHFPGNFKDEIFFLGR